MRENGVGPNGTESPGGESERITGQHSIVDVEESGERNAQEHVSRNIHRGNGEVQEWEQDQEESTSRTMDSRSCPSELLQGLYARARGRLQM